MKPDYSAYSKQELIEAYNSIDRERYPQTFGEIVHLLALEPEERESLPKSFKAPLPDELCGQFQNRTVLATSLSIALFLLGLWGTNHLFIDGSVDDLRGFFVPLLLLSPIGIPLARKKWKKHQYDCIVMNTEFVKYVELGHEKTINWKDLSKVWTVYHKRILSVTFEASSNQTLRVRPTFFGLNKSEVIEFIKHKSGEHTFEFERIGFLGISY